MSYDVILPNGRVFLSGTTRAEVDDMAIPVRCGVCGKIYDIGAVTVTQRYADCSVWKAPCCGVTTDDREWSHPRYQRITKSHE